MIILAHRCHDYTVSNVWIRCCSSPDHSDSMLFQLHHFTSLPPPPSPFPKTTPHPTPPSPRQHLPPPPSRDNRLTPPPLFFQRLMCATPALVPTEPPAWKVVTLTNACACRATEGSTVRSVREPLQLKTTNKHLKNNCNRCYTSHH